MFRTCNTYTYLSFWDLLVGWLIVRGSDIRIGGIVLPNVGGLARDDELARGVLLR